MMGILTPAQLARVHGDASSVASMDVAYEPLVRRLVFRLPPPGPNASEGMAASVGAAGASRYDPPLPLGPPELRGGAPHPTVPSAGRRF